MNTNLTVTDLFKTPAGLEDVAAAVQKVVDQASACHICGLKPPHFIINLDAGNGQTALTRYITDVYDVYNIRHFRGLDLYLEYRLDGSMEQLMKVFADIRACAVYTNDYEGVIALDIAGLSGHINEAQVDVFLHEISRISSAATLIFYVPSSMNRNIASLIGKIHETLDSVEMIHVMPYTPENFVEIIKRMLKDAGIRIEDSLTFDSFLLRAVTDNSITNVKEAKNLSQLLMKHANFDGFFPVLGSAELENIFTPAINEAKEGKEL